MIKKTGIFTRLVILLSFAVRMPVVDIWRVRVGMPQGFVAMLVAMRPCLFRGILLMRVVVVPVIMIVVMLVDVLIMDVFMLVVLPRQ